MTASLTIMSANLMNGLMQSAAFYEAMPEFLTVKHHADAMASSSSGCSSCQKRKALADVSGLFTATAKGLGGDGVARLKKFLNTDKLQMKGVDPTTGRFDVITL